MKIALIHPTDPRIDNDSITNYLKGILKYNSVYKEHEIIYYGISKLDSKKKEFIDKNNIYFKQIFLQPTKRYVPLTLKYMYLLWCKRTNSQFKGKILSFHGVEWALPFLYPKKTGKILLTIHGASKFNSIAWKNIFKIYFYKWIEELVIKRVDRIILVSKDGYEYYVSKYPKLSYKFTFVPTFVDEQLFFPRNDTLQLRRKYNINKRDIVLIYIGRLVFEKGLDILLLSFKKLKNKFSKLKLIIVGGGPTRKKLKIIIKNKQINDVVFFGLIDFIKIPEILNCADLFVLPSAFEGTSLAVLEAIACGVPVISFEVGDMNKIIDDGVNGYLVKDRNYIDFANAIEKGIKTRNIMKGKCSAMIKKYLASTIIPKILEKYLEIDSSE